MLVYSLLKSRRIAGTSFFNEVSLHTLDYSRI
jgi:hypothetical protein